MTTGVNPKRVASGSWRARIKDSNGADRYRTFKRKADADRWLAEQRGALAKGEQVNPSGERTPFGKVAEDWLAGRSVAIRPATIDRYRVNLDRHILPVFGQVPLGRIARVDIQRWVTRLAIKLAPSTVHLIYNVLASVLRHAVEERLIPMSEARRISLPKKTVEAHSIVPVTLAEVEKLAAAAGEWGPLILFAASTGMREGECLGLTADRVDLAARTIRVDRQLVLRSGHQPTLGPPKTSASVRTLPVGDWTCRLVAGRVGAIAGPELVFVAPTNRQTEAGRPIRRNRLGQVMRDAAAKVGLDVTFHDLRHFYASMLIASGASVKVVQARLGHASAVETLETYSHLWPESEEATRLAVDETFRGVTVTRWDI
jgi:integrase